MYCSRSARTKPLSSYSFSPAVLVVVEKRTMRVVFGHTDQFLRILQFGAVPVDFKVVNWSRRMYSS